MPFLYNGVYYLRLGSLTKLIWPKNGLNMTEKRSHRQTWMMELDRKITPTTMNGWTWPKYPWKWPKFLSALNSLGRWTWTVEYDRNNWFWSYSTVHVRSCHTFSVKFQRSCSLVWSFWSITHFSVIFIPACWFGQMIIPLLPLADIFKADIFKAL